MKMQVEIISVKNLVLSTVANCVSLFTKSGYVSIYPEHMNMIGRIDIGEIEVELDNESLFFVGIEGVYSVQENLVKILVSEAISIEEIDEERSLRARAEAESMLLNDDLEDQEIALLEALIRRESSMIDILKLRKK